MYDGLERRNSDLFCPSHQETRTDINSLKTKVNKISGWQIAMSLFLSVCFYLVLDSTNATREAVIELTKSHSKLDKQVTSLMAVDKAFRTTVYDKIDGINRKVTALEERVFKR